MVCGSYDYSLTSDKDGTPLDETLTSWLSLDEHTQELTVVLSDDEKLTIPGEYAIFIQAKTKYGLTAYR
jgi:hypothetical protein